MRPRALVSEISNNNVEEDEPIYEGQRQVSEKEKFKAIQMALQFLQNESIVLSE